MLSNAGNETVEKLAKLGMQTNFMMYLITVYNMDQVYASNILNTWSAISNGLPVIGAFIADAYLGKFVTIAIASFANLAVCFNFTFIMFELIDKNNIEKILYYF